MRSGEASADGTAPAVETSDGAATGDPLTHSGTAGGALGEAAKDALLLLRGSGDADRRRRRSQPLGGLATWPSAAELD